MYGFLVCFFLSLVFEGGLGFMWGKERFFGAGSFKKKRVGEV